MAAHRINLRGPWDYVWLGGVGTEQIAVPATGTVTMPKDWRTVFGEVSGKAQFRRKFHRPTNLDPHERVMIVFTEIGGRGRVSLNEQPVGEFDSHGESLSFDITSLLNPFNELAIEISVDATQKSAPSSGLSGVVALEIHDE